MNRKFLRSAASSKAVAARSFSSRGSNSGNQGGGSYDGVLTVLSGVLLCGVFGTDYAISRNELLNITMMETYHRFAPIDSIMSGVRSVNPLVIFFGDSDSKRAEAPKGTPTQIPASAAVGEKKPVATPASTSVTAAQVKDAKALIEKLQVKARAEPVKAAAAIPAPISETKAASTPSSSTPISTPVAPPTPNYTIAPTKSEIEANKLKTSNLASNSSEITTEMSNFGIALRKELEQSFLKDLHQLNENQLRIRVTQLAAEMFERSKWESLRLHQAMMKVEEDIKQKYSNLMTQQRLELELEAKKQLLKQESDLLMRVTDESQKLMVKFEEQMALTLQRQREANAKNLTDSLQAQEQKIHSELTARFNNEVANLHKEHNDDLTKHIADLSSLKSDIVVFESVISDVEDLQAKLKGHSEISSIMLSLEHKLSSNQPVERDVKLLRAALQASNEAGDAVLPALLDSIPESIRKDGAASIPDLRRRFTVVKDEALKASRVPEQLPTLIGHGVGSLLHYITPETRGGNVKGSDVDHVLSRAIFHIDNDDVSSALKEIDSVHGLPKKIMADWEKLARDRVIANEVAKSLRAKSLIRQTKGML